MTSPSSFTLDWLERAERDGTSLRDALAAFDRFEPVAMDALMGRWRGSELHTGHPLDGTLEAYGWYGKEFRDVETVFPLLFTGHDGEPFAVNPAWLPVRHIESLPLRRTRAAATAFRLGKRLLATRRPTARLRMISYRGALTATMIYDAQPIHDLFREAAPGVLLGLMDCRGLAPFFFVLRRDGV
jgi:hypothetical protein